MKQSTTRSVWIDLAKFISIFLVVLFHTNPHIDGYIFDFLQLLRMPAFFLIAGLLFNMDKWDRFVDFLKHRFKRLIVPYCCFYLTFYLLWLFVGRRMAGEAEMAIDPLLPLWEFIIGRPNVVLGPYWFITCLFIMQLLFYFMKKYLRSNWLIIALSVVAYMFLLVFGITDLPWCIDQALQYMPFYAYANILREYINRSILRKRWILLLLAILTILLLLLNNLLTPVALIHHLLYVVAGFCIMPVYIAFCKYVAAKTATFSPYAVIRFVGDNNIVTLALQNYIIGFIKIVGVATLGINVLTTEHYIINVLIAFATIVIAMGFAFLINRYTPFLIGKSR